MKTSIRPRRRALLSGATAPVLALSLLASPAAAQEGTSKTFVIAAQPLADALLQFSGQADVDIVASAELTRGRTAPRVSGEMTTGEALNRLLAGSGLTATPSGAGYILRAAQDPQGGSAGDVEALIVTAQKREENIQDVPIAISAFSQQALDEQKIEGGFDLLKAIPNVTFSKNNFTGYNFQIRGVGTKAVSATTDPAVAVSFNNTTLVRNRLFEQEYFDIERVEVLRGPQGTLYGRNATGGVVNIISAKPRWDFEGMLKAEVGNYQTRRMSGMINLPLGETFAVRLAGAGTERDGYGHNSLTGGDVDGRELWSTRLSAAWRPSDRLQADFVWEHFEEDDNRARTSKQLCHRDEGPASIGDVDFTSGSNPYNRFARAVLSQTCKPGSLYDDGAFSTPNGTSLPYILALQGFQIGYPTPGGPAVGYAPIGVDPYGGRRQSRDLRVIESLIEPVYRAKADIFQLNLEFDVTPDVTLYSQTTYNEDEVYSLQDYNRFNTDPILTDTSGLFDNTGAVSAYRIVSPGGFFNDPQLGPSNRIVAVDISRGESKQFAQEFRLQSSFEGPVNFSLGANYTDLSVEDDYFLVSNALTMIAVGDNSSELLTRPGGVLTVDGLLRPMDVYIDPKPIDQIDGYGRNYFRSRNPYELTSYAAFGEVYWQLAETLKVTAGLRYTDDKKTFSPYPSMLLEQNSLVCTDSTDPCYKVFSPEELLTPGPDVKQKWREITGRLGVDWKPEVSFTDETMAYAFYSRGYKGGGANPPSMGGRIGALIQSFGADNPATFEPEFVDAFEVGVKNTLLGGSMVLNAGAFYYDYKDYQVSKIVDRIALNENFDAKVWGLEFEALWSPTRNLRFNANIGYLDTRLADGEKSVDLMDRTQGDPDWMVVKPWVQFPSNCIAPRAFVEEILERRLTNPMVEAILGPNPAAPIWGVGELSLCGNAFASDSQFRPILNLLFGPDALYDLRDAPNGGAGFDADLSGNELPNSPHWTFNVGAQYVWNATEGWDVTVRGDYYRQSDSFARVYNTEYDRLKGWDNLNLSVKVERPDDDLRIEVYVKNVFDNDPITDAFLNSDDTGLTTNVFVLDPRLVGVSFTKGF